MSLVNQLWLDRPFTLRPVYFISLLILWHLFFSTVPRRQSPYHTLRRLEQYHGDLQAKHTRLCEELAELGRRAEELRCAMTSDGGAAGPQGMIAQDMLSQLQRKAESVRANADIVGRLTRLVKERLDALTEAQRAKTEREQVDKKTGHLNEYNEREDWYIEEKKKMSAVSVVFFF